MYVTNKSEIDLSRGPNERNTPEIQAYQGEICSRKIEFTLTDGDKNWVIPSNAVCLIRFVKPDGHGGVYSFLPDTTNAWSVTENKVTILLVPQMFDVPGHVEGEVVLLWGDQSLTATDFHIIVVRNPNITEEKVSDYYNYQNLDGINTAFTKIFAKLADLTPEKIGASTKLLWENAAPTSNFPAQTISVNLSKYKYIVVLFRWAFTSGSYRPPCIAFVGAGAQGVQYPAPDGLLSRSLTPTTTGITFTDADLSNWNWEGETTIHNELCIPIRIYGCV